jgi:hypothetical protein
MGSAKTNEALKNAFMQFSSPFKTVDEVKVVSLRFDAIVAMLLGSPYVRSKLGQKRTSELSAISPDLPVLFGEIGGPAFVQAAEPASDLLEISRSSVSDFDNTDDEVAAANIMREKFYRACGDILVAINSLPGKS